MLETGFKQMMWIIGGATLIGTALSLFLPVHGVHACLSATRSRPNAVIANGRFTHSREQFERMLLCEINAVGMITLLPPNRTLMPRSLSPRR
jgi:hypothetical protein